MRRYKAAIIAVATAGATLVGGAVPAQGKALFNTYVITRSAATFVPQGTADLFPGGVDDAVARVAFPFPVNIYGHNRSSAYVSSNGNVQFATTRPASAAYVNSCLPDPNLAPPAVSVYFDDIVVRGTTTDGVFTKTVGRSPNRSFVISWIGTDYSTATVLVKVQVVFYERRGYFDMIYGNGDGYDATIGVQNNAGDSTQFLCNPRRHGVVTSGERLRYTFTRS